MMTTEPASFAGVRIGILKSVVLLVVALIPWPDNWDAICNFVDTARSPESGRDGHAMGYYESLIGGSDGADGPAGELSLRFIARPGGLVRSQATDVVRFLERDFLQFELKPLVHRTLLGQPFVTNSFGMHDDPVTLEKPVGTFRIAVLGASMDMGWGVKYQDTYINRLQEWLGDHAASEGLTPPRRFEVLNFAVAAYSPLQRLETLRRKVLAFQPDLVIYSATTLDSRLMEIHICELLRKKVDLKYDFVRDAAARAGIGDRDLRTTPRGRKRLKSKLRPFYWGLYDRTVGAIAAECRSADVPLVIVIIPRVGKEDVPAARAEPVARLKAMAAHNALPIIDLTDTFDQLDPASLAITASDNHPNATGHQRLFQALAGAVVDNVDLSRLLFHPDERARPEQTTISREPSAVPARNSYFFPKGP
jgi:hypothetical protein